jgi:hypothetical protein
MPSELLNARQEMMSMVETTIATLGQATQRTNAKRRHVSATRGNDAGALRREFTVRAAVNPLTSGSAASPLSF